MSDKHNGTCAVHEVLMGSLQDQINNIERGQEEMKDLLISAHKETLADNQKTAEQNRRMIEKLDARLDKEVNKFYERDRELVEMVHKSDKKTLIITTSGIAIATTVTFLVNLFNLAQKVIPLMPVITQ